MKKIILQVLVLDYTLVKIENIVLTPRHQLFYTNWIRKETTD